MCPEYGATVAIFPIDDMTLEYLRLTGRDAKQIALVEAYAKAQGLFRTADSPDATYSETMELDLAIGGAEPRRSAPSAGSRAAVEGQAVVRRGARRTEEGREDAGRAAGGTAVATATQLEHGSVVIAAITSCTNTSNPSVMIGAGLVAKKAVEKGLTRKPWVKTSLAPGSKVVTDYLKKSGLDTYLDRLGFNLVGYGCTTCIGNSGPLPDEISAEINERGLVVASVLSGNRNFEGRIQQDVRANYLASPPLVVAYALAGSMNIDVTQGSARHWQDGKPVYLKDVWPTEKEIQQAMLHSVTSEAFRQQYASVFDGDVRWQKLPVPTGDRFEWEGDSTYVRKPPFLEGLVDDAGAADAICAMRARWRCSATASPPITFLRPATSRRTARRAST